MEIVAEHTYTVRCTRREFNLITRAVGFFGGVDVSFKEEERAELRALNMAMLEQQAANLRQQVDQVDAKLAKAQAQS